MCLLIWVEVHYLSTNHYVWIADGQSLRDKQWINKDQPNTGVNYVYSWISDGVLLYLHATTYSRIG